MTLYVSLAISIKIIYKSIREVINNGKFCWLFTIENSYHSYFIYDFTDGSSNALCQITVEKHFLTLNPTQDKVMANNELGCVAVNESKYLQCDGELSGTYTWSQENPDTNYVLFVLNQKMSVSLVNMTYTVNSPDEKPKVSFCPLPDNVGIKDKFMGLRCKAVSIQPGSRVTESIEAPFTNETNRVLMEVITEGIKVEFEAISVEFYGVNCAAISEGTVQYVYFSLA